MHESSWILHVDNVCVGVVLLMCRLTSCTISKDGRIVTIDDTWHEKTTRLRVGLLLQT